MVDFHRVPFAILAVVVLVIAGSLAYFWRTYEEPLSPDYGWGAARTLTLGITLERTAVSENGTIDFTTTLTNIGTEKVRIFPWDWYVSVDIRLTNGSSLDPPWPLHYSHQLETGPEGKTMTNPNATVPRPSDRDFNQGLVVLAQNGTYSRQWSVGNDSSWRPGWPLRPGFNASIQVECSFYDFRPPPALPVWTGTIRSDWKNFTVIP